ncbi:hypothetical protein F5Y14DRAFT_449784 [Nemania sp. NC0429]|nr:hypothetical protein F5Y14DRAFT_449784 [Nemania sp. NC0429]
MPAFDFKTACDTITRCITESWNADVAIDQWKRWLPRFIAEEIEKAESLEPVIGLRSPSAVQQSICKTFWLRLYNGEPVPWPEDPESEITSVCQSEKMEISVIRAALTASYTDVNAALRILATNSVDVRSYELGGSASTRPSNIEVELSASRRLPSAEISFNQRVSTESRAYYEQIQALDNTIRQTQSIIQQTHNEIQQTENQIQEASSEVQRAENLIDQAENRIQREGDTTQRAEDILQQAKNMIQQARNDGTDYGVPKFYA